MTLVFLLSFAIILSLSPLVRALLHDRKFTGLIPFLPLPMMTYGTPEGVSYFVGVDFNHDPLCDSRGGGARHREKSRGKNGKQDKAAVSFLRLVHYSFVFLTDP